TTVTTGADEHTRRATRRGRHGGAPILSAIRNQPTREDVAMTGEITLSGLVLPVGGIREKALAGRRHRLHTFVLPARNTVDLEELPADLKDSMTFVPVETLDQVLKVAF